MATEWKVRANMANDWNEELLNDYFLQLKLQNRSDLTFNAYRRVLEYVFADFQKSIPSITSDEILQVISEDRDLVKDTTIKFRLTVLSSFYTFCTEEEVMDETPIKKRWYPKLNKPVPRYLDKEEVAKVRQACETAPLRHQVLVEFLLATGCRISEAQQLNCDNLDFDNRRAHVVGKGTKIREVHFTERCAVFLERYLASRTDMSQPLFITSTGKRLGVRQIQLDITNIGKKAGLKDDLHPHRLRHTFATHLLGKGADLGFIGDELGHRDLATTRVYARLPESEIVSQYRKLMG